jgi:hypothetical protein
LLNACEKGQHAEIHPFTKAWLFDGPRNVDAIIQAIPQIDPQLICINLLMLGVDAGFLGQDPTSRKTQPPLCLTSHDSKALCWPARILLWVQHMLRGTLTMSSEANIAPSYADIFF